MANLTGSASWDNVPQLETTTLVLGGVGGPANSQAQSLINRTEVLNPDNQALPSSLTGDEAWSVKNGSTWYKLTPSKIINFLISIINSDSISEGVSHLFFTASRVLNTALSGVSISSTAAITSSDTVLTAAGKLQGQINSISNSIVGENKLINSSFRINQLNVSGTVTLAAGAYGHDQWKAGASGCTYTFSTTNGITTINITAGTLMQPIEGQNLQSGTYVLSWSGTAQGRIDSGSYGASGITGTNTGGVLQTVEFSTGTVSVPKFEFGSVPTAYLMQKIDQELLDCQRYFQRIRMGCCVGQTTSSVTVAVRLFNKMRIAPPAVTQSAPMVITNGPSDYTQSTASAISVYSTYDDMIVLALPNFTGITAGASYLLRCPANQTLDISARM
jgi:hypothetical protein